MTELQTVAPEGLEGVPMELDWSQEVLPSSVDLAEVRTCTLANQPELADWNDWWSPEPVTEASPMPAPSPTLCMGTVSFSSTISWNHYRLQHPGTILLCLTESHYYTFENFHRTYVWLSDSLTHLADSVASTRPDTDAASDPLALIELLQGSMALSPAELAPLVGVKKRAIYNWLRGKSIGKNSAARIAQLASVLKPLTDSRDPLLVRSWLLSGEPSPATLIAAEQWEELGRLVVADTQPLKAAARTDTSAGEPPARQPDAVFRETLAALSTPPAKKGRTRAGWQPRELTGINPHDQEVTGSRRPGEDPEG